MHFSYFIDYKDFDKFNRLNNSNHTNNFNNVMSIKKWKFSILLAILTNSNAFIMSIDFKDLNNLT